MDEGLRKILERRVACFDVTPEQAVELALAVIEGLEEHLERNEPWAERDIQVCREAGTLLSCQQD